MITLDEFLKQKLDEFEKNHQYEVATDTIRAWIDLYYGE